MKKTLLSALAVVAMVSCSNNDESGVKMPQGGLKFEATAAALESRTAMDDTKKVTWLPTDKIGISMLNGTTLVDLNVPYVASPSQSDATKATFAFDVTATNNKAITLPNSGTVDFVAYSPFSTSNVSPTGLYYVALADQSGAVFNIANYDLITAKVAGYEVQEDDADNATVGFAFEHQLAVLELSVECRDDISDLSGLTATILGANAMGVFDLAANSFADSYIEESIKMQSVVTDADVDSAVVTAVMLPTDDAGLAADSYIEFVADGRTFHLDVEGVKIEAGKYYKYNVLIGYDKVEFTDESSVDGWDVETGADDLKTDEVVVD